MASFRLSEQELDPSALRCEMIATSCGAFVSFEGWVRDHHAGKEVAALDYQAYAAMAESEGQRLLEEACARFAIVDARAVHRVGALQLSDVAVWVGVCAAHRDAAFAACRWIIDELKSRVPIWKREHYCDGISDWLHP